MMLDPVAGGGMNPSNGFPRFFTEVSDRLGRYRDYRAAASSIAARFDPSVYGALLDVCSGPGHFANELAQTGYMVTGIELSADQVEAARDRYSLPTFVHGDMGNLPDRTFDILTNVYTSFGYLETVDADFRLLSHWGSRLRDGGFLVMELADLDRARNRIPQSGQLVRKTDDITELLSFDWSRNILQVEYVTDDHERWTCFTRIYSSDDLVNALKTAGFSRVDTFGSFDGRAKDPDDNLVVFARK